MRANVPLVVLLLLAITAGYVVGTENGRLQRDVILVKLGRKQADEPNGTADEDSA